MNNIVFVLSYLGPFAFLSILCLGGTLQLLHGILYLLVPWMTFPETLLSKMLVFYFNPS